MQNGRMKRGKKLVNNRNFFCHAKLRRGIFPAACVLPQGNRSYQLGQSQQLSASMWKSKHLSG